MTVYQDLYNIIIESIYGGAEITAWMDLVATLTATFGTIFVVAIPFVITWRIIKAIIGG